MIKIIVQYTNHYMLLVCQCVCRVYPSFFLFLLFFGFPAVLRMYCKPAPYTIFICTYREIVFLLCQLSFFYIVKSKSLFCIVYAAAVCVPCTAYDMQAVRNSCSCWLHSCVCNRLKEFSC